MGLLLRAMVLAAWCLPMDAAGAEAYLELTRFTLVDGTGQAARPVERLVARNGVIVAIDGKAPAPGSGSTWTRVDLDGAWVIPGLVDTHVHVARFPDTRAHASRILRSALRGGVTAVRDLTGDARALAELERAIATGELAGPTLVFSALFGGPDIFTTGPTASMADGRAPGEAPWTQRIGPDTDLPLAVARAIGSGARVAKVYGHLDATLAHSLVAEARRQEMLVAAHATVFPAAPGGLVDAGVQSLSHAPYLVWEAVDPVPADYNQRIAGPWDRVAADHPKLLALYRRMAEQGVFLDATLFIYKAMRNYSPEVKANWSEEAFRWGAEATRHAHRAGVRVTTGTDWFEPNRDWELPNTHAELALLVEVAGFTPMEAIIAATRNGAAALGLADRGTLEVGKAADLVVLDADPLADIANTRSIRMVVRQGQVVR